MSKLIRSVLFLFVLGLAAPALAQEGIFARANCSADLASPVSKKTLCWDQTLARWRAFDGSWIDISKSTSAGWGPTDGGTGQSTYTKGDILYASVANVLSKLGIGTNGQCLTVATDIPGWASCSVGALTSLNGLTASVQTFAAGSTGTDFTINSSGSTHTWNIPSSSAANRGLLTAADWAAFNAKEAALTFNSPLSRSTNTISCATCVTTSRAVNTGAGLAGGGALSGDLTLTWAPETRVASIVLWDGANASRTITYSLSGATDPILTLSDASFDISTGTLKQGGTAVVLQSRAVNTSAPLGGGGALSGDLTITCATCSITGHTHAAADIISGVIATARLGSGVADATTFLRGDQTWATPAAAAGDITDVWSCTTGNCNALTGAAGDSLDAGAADASSPATRSTTLPATCAEGQMHQDTDSGGSESYICTATNTWTKLAATTDTAPLATALAANAANCSTGAGAGGTSAAGAAEDCTDYMEEPAASGIIAKTAANTSAGRTITGTSPIGVTNGDGVSGNPTVACATCVTSAAVLGDTKVVVGSGGAQGTAASALTATVVKMAAGVPSAANVGTDYGTPDASAKTLTNTTLDAEGTGNVISIPVNIWLPAAGCNNATAGPIWDLPATTPAAAACVTGTNIQKGVLDYADSGPFVAQITLALPADWTTTGGLDIALYWTTTATSGNAKWNVSTICTAVNAAATDDPAFNTANTVTTAAPGTASRVQTSTIAALTTTSCTTATAMLLHLKVQRDGTDAADTIAATARFIGAEMTYRRAM